MPVSTALSLIPVNERINSRFQTLSAELIYAWDRTDSSATGQWSRATAATFGRSLKRRASNLFTLAGRIGIATATETLAAVGAFRADRLAHHLGARAGAAYVSVADLVTRVKVATSQVAKLVQSQPRDAIPQLLVLVATSIVVSGGPDGDGGAPDLDLQFGIDAHRSILSHSILMGAALETGFLSLVHLVQLVHGRLPANHDPLWDELARHAGSVAHAANTGASLGMSYHLLVDGLLQPAAYHDLPVSLPIEGHQAVLTANAAAEAIDIKHKPAPMTVPRGPPRGRESRKPHAPHKPSTAKPPAVVASSAKRVLPWWETATALEIETTKQLHRQYQAESCLIDPFVSDMLADEELLIIERHGPLLEALASGAVRPLTCAQENFVLVTTGQRQAETPLEQAWMMYQSLLAFAPNVGAAN